MLVYCVDRFTRRPSDLLTPLGELG
ncbi:hypothetical protein ACQP2P_39450 [Dactylosporangium sp. CA-139114]